MEKEQAIETLRANYPDACYEQLREAVDSAIEALKAQLSQEGTTSDLISKFIDGLEEIFAHIREKHVDDSVCGLCEYDGAYIGQSGDWCNECPGFNRDDCFKLSDKTRKEWTEEIIKALPTIQPEKEQLSCGGTTSDLISRQAAIDAVVQCTNCGDEDTLRKYVLKHNLDNGWTGGILEALDAVKDLPPVQPEPHEGHWIGKYPTTHICSECGWLIPDSKVKVFAYCPNCGARMRGERQK